MRLDHLLSKEHLTTGTPVVQSLTCRRTSCRGSSWVEHRLLGTGSRRPPVLPLGEWNAEHGPVPDTLLGPEGTGNRSFETDAREPCAPGRFGRGQVRGCTARHAGVSTAPDLGPARTLRTAQWTRASSFCVQVTKGTRWMSWHQKPMKDVGACEKPWGAGNRAVIQGCPNGETRLESCPVTSA